MGSTNIEVLGRIRAALREAHGDRLSGVVLFGSEARGDAGDDSDIDVLVLLDGPIRYADDLLANLVALDALSEELHRRISPKPIDAEGFLRGDSPLVRTARDEGLRL
jgi:predicted nucleotidyltransferase